MTQTERVLAALQNAGQRGITAVDFVRFPTPDGGAPITRVAARIEELRSAGYRIVSGPRRDKCVTYQLERDLRVEQQRHDASPSPVVADESGWATPSLGGLREGEHPPGSSATTGPQNAIFDWEG